MAGDKTGRGEERFRGLSPERRVEVAIEMIDACVRVSADGIRSEDLDIDDEQLMKKLRERLKRSKRGRVVEG